MRARPTAVAAALFLALLGAQAQDKPAPEAAQPPADELIASATAGAGLLLGDRGDRLLFGQYRGHRQRGVLLLGGEYWRHDAESGRSVTFRAEDLGSDSRSLDLVWKQPGEWKLAAGYRELTRRETATVRSGLIGFGSATPQVTVVPAGSGSEHALKTTRQGLGLAYTLLIGSDWQFDLELSSEDKRGARLWGTGFTCPSAVAPGCRGSTGTETGWALLLLPEPIRANHSQIEARLAWGGATTSLSLGYHGSYYRNRLNTLAPAVPGSLYNALGTLLPLATGLQAILAQPVALPPDSQAHQFDLTGTHAFTPHTRLNFKLAQTRATQGQDFVSAGLADAPAGVTQLDGLWVTTLAQVNLSARPLPRLTLRAELRHEDRDDRTPLALYNVEGTASYTNRQLPLKRERARAQASWQFTHEVRGSLGVEAESIDRGTFTASSAVSGLTALRARTDETLVRAELNARVSESLSGGLRLVSSERDGSSWLRDNSGLGVTEVSDPNDVATGFALGVFMPTLADRRRERGELHAHWQPTEELSLQLALHEGRDRYSAPSAYGLRRNRLGFASLDWDYAYSESWKLQGWFSHGTQALALARPAGVVMDYDNRTSAIGVGTTFRATAKIELGAQLGWIDDRSVYAQTLEPTAHPELAALLATSGGLPDIRFRQSTLRLHARYEIDKSQHLRVEAIGQRTRWTDWAWAHDGQPFVYSDGSTVQRAPLQNAGFVGITYTRSWR